MKAAVLHAFGTPLELVERDVEPVGEGQALIEVLATGLCGTDAKIANGAIPSVRLPRVPGHEISGKLVTPAAGLDAGTLVAVYINDGCGHCSACARGSANLCPDARRIGLERDGGLAQFVTVPAACLLPIPVDADPAAAAVSMDSVASPWRALTHHATIVPGSRVLVVGAGGLGLNAVQIAVHLGASVAVLEPNEDARRLARSYGAVAAVGDINERDISPLLRDGFDVSLEMSGTPEGLGASVGALTPGGIAVVCGYRPGVGSPVDSTAIAMGERRIVGSRGASLSDARQALEAVVSGAVRPLISEEGALEDVNRFISKIASGQARGRLVINKFG